MVTETGWFKVKLPPPVMTVSLRDFRIDALEVQADRAFSPGAYIVRAAMRVPAMPNTAADIKAGEVIPVHCSDMVDARSFERMDRDGRARLVKGLLMRLMEHELEEKLMIDGEYAFDPHRTGRIKPKQTEPAHPPPAPKPAKVNAKPKLEADARYPRSKRVAGKFPSRDLVVPKKRGTPWGRDLRGRL